MTSEQLYLDLLIRCVANTIYGDPPQPPMIQVYDRAQREEGKDLPSVAHSMAGLKRLMNLRDLCLQVLDERIAGDFIETGAWRGGACILMRGVLAARNEKSRCVWVADSFEGFPPPDKANYPADHASPLHLPFHQFPQFAVSVEEVARNFAAYGLLDEQVRFVKGWFRDTLSNIPANHFAIIRLDGDLYESTLQGLEALYPRLAPGGFLIVDDYGCFEYCRQAVTDYRAANGISAGIVAVDWTGVYWRKPL